MRCLMMILIFTMFSGTTAAANDLLYHTTFARDGWDRNQWVMVKSPRWDHFNQWIQHENHIANPLPADVPQGKLASGPSSFTSMVLKEKIDTQPGVRVSATMSFSYDQAPQIVIAPTLGYTSGGVAEYREHYEVVLFSGGVNIWHHTYHQGEPYWRLVAYMPFTVEADVQYQMSVAIDPSRGRKRADDPDTGRLLTVAVADRSFSYYAPNLPHELHLGITGYASHNRFFDFTVEAE